MRVEIVNTSNWIISACAMASEVCTSPKMPNLYEVTTSALNHAIASGHDSVLEHVTITFAIEGISRACSHQLVRHRLASYSQQSQRYVNFVEMFDYVTPPQIAKEPSIKAKYDNAMQNLNRLYHDLIEIGYCHPEDARYILPNACCTNLIMTMNLRELKHFMELRLCQRAQWEIRELAEQMKECLDKEVPDISKLIKWVPQCERLGYCPESRGCGKYGKKQ